VTGRPGRPPTIALDGPAAAGKTTVGRRLAETLGYLFFDTGVLYRALALQALAEGVSPEDGVALAALAERREVAVEARPGLDPGYVVLLAGHDVTAALRSPEVDRTVSPVSRHPEVRSALLETQRSIAASGEAVVVGRDIGTAVLPDADLKLYLDASTEARARRRADELARRGLDVDYEAVLADLLARDAQDAGRASGPLAVAPDAVVVDTDNCGLDEVVAHLAALAARWPDALTTGGGSAPCGEERA
jgi:cytidylate kinase